MPAATCEQAPRLESTFDTERRRLNDIATWLAEVLPGEMRTPFEYTFDGKDLIAEDGGSMGKVFADSLKKSELLPPHLAFEHRRCLLEMGEYQDMLAMMRGERPNTMIVLSDFPPELMEASEDVGGYNVTRKPTMMRIISKRGNKLHMVSQTLDGSDRQALEAICNYTGDPARPGELLGQRRFLDLEGIEQEFLPDWLRGIYDKSLSEHYGGEWQAGRPLDSKPNTYNFVTQQVDLLTVYLATTDRFTGGHAEYNLAAAMRQRYLDGQSFQQGTMHIAAEAYEGLPLAVYVSALTEMDGAGVIARRQGVVVSGCGETLEGKEGDAESQLKDAGYGSKAEAEEQAGTDKFGSLKFKCPDGHTNVRPYNKLLKACQKSGCKAKVTC